MEQIKDKTENVNENTEMQALLKEYELAIERMDKQTDRFVQLLVGGVAFLGAGFVAIFQLQNTEEVAWLVLLFFSLFYSIIIYLLYISIVEIWVCRILADRINTKLGGIALIRTSSKVAQHLFFSTTRGNYKYLALIIFIFGANFLLYSILASMFFKHIYNGNHFLGFIYFFFNFLLIAFMIFLLSGVFIDLPNLFRIFQNKSEALGRFITNKELLAVMAESHYSLKWFYILFPRPFDILVKGPMFFYGFAAALVFSSFSADRLVLANTLFLTSLPEWKSSKDISLFAIVMVAVIFFLVEEVILQQSKLLWDDIRDIKRDKTLLLNRDRALASGIITKKEAVFHVIVRWCIGMVLGYILGGLLLLFLFFLISLHQMLYVLWGKVRAEEHPLQLLFLIAFNAPLRVATGMVAVAGGSFIHSPELLAILVFFYFNSFGTMAAFWRIEGEYYLKELNKISIRSQSDFYIKNGCFWQRVGFLSQFFVSALLLILFRAKTLLFNIPSEIIIVLLVILSIGAILGFSLIYNTFLRFFSWTRSIIFDLNNKINKCKKRSMKISPNGRAYRPICLPNKLPSFIKLLTLPLFLISIALLIISVSSNISFLFLFGLLIMSLSFLINFEGISYPEYTLMELKTELPIRIKAIYMFLFGNS